MGAVLFYAAFQTQSWYYMPTWRYAALLGLIALGLLSYAALAQITGALRIKDLKTIAQRSR
jgi:putative peptidoglycan lipid II flippase